MNNLLEIKNLYKNYQTINEEIIVLKNINFKLKKGELLALVGPSGIGKSTLLSIISGLENWYNEIKKNNIKCIILSNSNKEDKIRMVADLLNIPFIKFATKPLKRGFKKAKKMLGEDSQNIAVVGDQIFTDVIGANRCKMFSILVKPIAKKDLWMTKFKRPLENLIIKKYLKSR